MLKFLNHLLNGYLLLPGLVALGVYLTLRLRFLQLSKLKVGFSHLFRRNQGAEGDISHYQAVSSVLAGNFGTGNISGMAIALMMGGPGALVWMWIMAFFGSIIQYASCLLGVKYRTENEKGEYVGGPMYYIQKGLGMRWLSLLFALFVILGALSVGIFCQINSMALSLSMVGVTPWVTGSCHCCCCGAGADWRGQKGGARCSCCDSSHGATLFGQCALHFGRSSAADSACLCDDVQKRLLYPFGCWRRFGFGIMQVVSTGIGRALFATDVGTGYVPILQSGARSRHHVIDGAVALVAPLLVMVVCTITALVLIVTGADQVGLQSTQMVVHAFQTGVGPVLGSAIVNVALLLFGYTTILAWACCFERAVGFLFGCKVIKLFRLLFVSLIPISALFEVGFVWALADVALALMTLVNLVGIFGLSREVIDESRSYFLVKS